MTSTADKIKIMQAYEDGEAIEIFDKGNKDDWYDKDTPQWNWTEYDYRIKPKPPATDWSKVERGTPVIAKASTGES